MLPASFAEATAVKMWKYCQDQYQLPMKGAGVGEEKSHVQDDVRRQKSQISGVVRIDFRQKL